LSSFEPVCRDQNFHFDDWAEEEALRAVVEGADQRVDSLIRQTSAELGAAVNIVHCKSAANIATVFQTKSALGHNVENHSDERR